MRYRLLLYRALIYLCLPFGLVWSLFEKRHRVTLLHRLGFKGWPRVDRGGILLHAVSVGETLSIQTLIKALSDRRPDLPITLSTTTVTGQNLAKKSGATASYFPIDTCFAVKPFLSAISPALVVIVETEVWPCFIANLKRKGIPLLLINGRLSDSSFRGYSRFARFWQPFFQSFDLILAKSDRDAERFKTLGAVNVEVTGNLKFDFSPPSLPAETQDLFGAITHERLSWAAGSTMEGEEKIILALHREIITRHPDALLLLAPRHPARIEEACETCNSLGLTWTLRSDMSKETRTQVILLDTIGELAALYSYFPLVFIGGTLVPTGGHNPIEPAYWGSTVVVGPHMENFSSILQVFLDDDAIVQTDPENLKSTILELLEDPGSYGERARTVVERHRGALERTLQRIEEVLP